MLLMGVKRFFIFPSLYRCSISLWNPREELNFLQMLEEL
jgi:hypothetical protein